MKNYEKDSSAAAVVLYDYGDISYTYNDMGGGIKIISKYIIRIKVLKKSGMDMADITIPYTQDIHGDQETITNIQGYTYNSEKGEIVRTKLTKESVFDEHIVDKHYQKKITMPDIREGSVFEYTFTRETPFGISDKPRTWYFQGRVPSEWSELNITIPNYFRYKIILGGYFPLLINTNEQVSVVLNGDVIAGSKYRWAIKDIPAFYTESFITTESDYISKVSFELSSVVFPNSSKNYTETWEDITKTLLEAEHFGQKLNRSNYLREIVAELSVLTDSTEKINAAFQYVSTNLKWDHSNSVFAEDDLKKVLDNKKGNVSELNLLLVNILRELGFDSNPVILSTRSNGKIKEEYPMLDDFNYVITQVNIGGKDILMDATDPFSSPGILPERCLNGDGRLIKKDNSRFISLEPSEKYMKFELVNATLNKSGELKGNYSMSCGGYSALEERTRFYEEGENKLLEEIKKNKADWQIENFKQENKEALSGTYNYSYDFTSDNVTSSPEKIYLNPVLSGRITDNPFKEQERVYPVDFEKASDETFVASIKIPEGYEAEELPQSAIVTLPDNAGKFTYSLDVTDDMIRISSRISINKAHFSSQEYYYLKELYDKIIQKHSEQIILKRK